MVKIDVKFFSPELGCLYFKKFVSFACHEIVGFCIENRKLPIVSEFLTDLTYA